MTNKVTAYPEHSIIVVDPDIPDFIETLLGEDVEGIAGYTKEVSSYFYLNIKDDFDIAEVAKNIESVLDKHSQAETQTAKAGAR